ncbi:DUF2079 domain-containing protein [Nesterenkonia alba]|uniref:DUF2079 domain-containing protein n=1 Tax=Nesterenkonia alba TaxID=515814 RepID=UPI0003FD646A|nr:DUF2079 domain-containing protein [Nesterenkonia alba]
MPTRHKVHLALVMGAFGLLAAAHSLLRFRNFEAKGYDLGIFDQAVRQYSLLKPPMVPVKGEDFHLLGDHFHPIIAAFAPLYWIWDDPRMLNMGMIALLVSTALPVYLVVRGWFSHGPALLSATALLLWWPFQALVNWDFHEIAFGVPLIAWVIWAIERKRYWLAFALSASLLLVREDMGATLLAIAVVFAVRRAWLQASLTAVLGVAGLWIAVGVVIPYFAPAGEFQYWEYTSLGATASAAALTVLTRPWEALVVLFDHPLKVGLWLLHFLPLWFAPLLSPYVLIGLPILLSRLWNDRLNVWAPVYQYDAILAPVFLLAAGDVIRRLVHHGRLIPRWRPRHRPAISEVLSRRRRRLALALPATVVLLGVIGSLVFPQVFPYQRTLTAQNWSMSERAEAHQRAVDLIPDGVCVEAADTAVPHLVDRTYVGLHGTTAEEDLAWLIIDDRVEELGGTDPLTPEEAFARAERLGFETVTADDEGLWVLHRDIPTAQKCRDYLTR